MCLVCSCFFQQFVKDERVALRSENEDLKEKISKIKAAEAEKEHLCKKVSFSH